MSAAQVTTNNTNNATPMNFGQEELALNLAELTNAPVPLPNAFPFGGQPDIVRSNQKDVYYQQVLKRQLSDIVLLFKGSRYQATHLEQIDQTSKFLYNGLTTLLGSQTLGEEYCDIMQFVDMTKTYPTLLRRLTLVLLTSGGSSALKKSISTLQKQLLVYKLRNPNSRYQIITKVVEWLAKSENFEWTASSITTLHLMIFYFSGQFYHISKRLAGIRYVFTRSLGKGEESIGYEILGALLFVQFIVRLAIYLNSKRKAAKVEDEKEKQVESDSIEGLQWSIIGTETEETEKPDASSPAEAKDEAKDDTELLEKITQSDQSCSLCWSEREHSASTPCGHLFCWDCIFEWQQVRSECPLCRQPMKSSQILPVYHY